MISALSRPYFFELKIVEVFGGIMLDQSGNHSHESDCSKIFTVTGPSRSFVNLTTFVHNTLSKDKCCSNEQQRLYLITKTSNFMAKGHITRIRKDKPEADKTNHINIEP